MGMNMGGKMKSKITKSAIWATAVAVVLFTFILAGYSGLVSPAAIARHLATAASNLVNLIKSLNLSQYRPDIGNVSLVAFLVLLIFWRSLLIKKAQV